MTPGQYPQQPNPSEDWHPHPNESFDDWVERLATRRTRELDDYTRMTKDNDEFVLETNNTPPPATTNRGGGY